MEGMVRLFELLTQLKQNGNLLPHDPYPVVVALTPALPPVGG